MKIRVLWFIVAVTALCWSQRNTGSVEAKISPDEYQVYAAVLDFFHAAHLATQPAIAKRTSTFACDMGCNGMNMGGCNGLRGSDETPQQRLSIVKRDLPAMQPTTVSDFLARNQQCAAITGDIPTQVHYFKFSMSEAESKPANWQQPDYFYFSRVGFNADHSQALVHVSFMSGTNGSDSGGKYLLFTKKNGAWARVGSSAVWQLMPK